MPEEFIDDNLKGASAIAYKIVYEPVEHCGWGGDREVCTRKASHGIEIYYKSDRKMPIVSDTKFSYRALYMLDYSKHLLSTNGINAPTKGTSAQWFQERPGAQNKFAINSIFLAGVKETKIVWPVSGFGQQIYVDDVMYGYNLLVLEGTMGGFVNPRMEKLGIDRYTLVFRHPDDKSKLEGQPLSQVAHSIEFPKWFFEKLREIDRADSKKRDEILQGMRFRFGEKK